MLWLLLILLSAGSWYLALSKRADSNSRDWPLKPFQPIEEERNSRLNVRPVVALVAAIFFTGVLVLGLLGTVLAHYLELH